jgi:hypothetical protein
MSTVTVIEEVATVVGDDAPVTLVSEGIQGPPGPQGPMGPAGSTSVLIKAGASIGGHRVITLDGSGRGVYADPTNLVHSSRVLGLSMHAADLGADLNVLRDGDITEPSWSWDINKPIYLGLDGTLVQEVSPGSAFTMIVGFPISATKMYFSIGISIINS